MSEQSEPMLRMQGVVAGYGGGDVLQGVDITVPAGSVACIVGPNGAGKSTVLKTVSGLLSPRLGEVYLRGEPIHKASASRDPRARRLPGAAVERTLPATCPYGRTSCSAPTSSAARRRW